MLKRSLAGVAACCLLALAGCGGSTPHQSAAGSVHPPGWGGTPKGYVVPAPRLLTAVPTATMFDAVTVGNIPARPFAAAGYTAGLFVTWPSIQRLAQHAVSIAIQARYHADCLDVEPGDAVPSQAGPWALADIRAGFRIPCLYSDLSEMPAVRASLFASFGASWHSRVFLWLAWYRFIPGLVAGYDAVQYSDRCLGRGLDCSTVTLAFLRIAQPPLAPPRPKPRPGPKPSGCDKRCHQARALAATRRAITSVEHGLAANHCRTPYRRDVCVDLGREILPVLHGRDRYFARELGVKP